MTMIRRTGLRTAQWFREDYRHARPDHRVLSDELGAQTTSAIFSFDHRVSDDEAAADAFVTHDSEDVVAEAVTRGAEREL
jgi:hypothetical protein